ncbi:hypothetical protein OG824_08375 [Streptomyces prunicolor]|nr:hypothetical protein [Streptomyces prunicolor]MCX5235240.1 hypothetical protein [Streptomyces prunicolor]
MFAAGNKALVIALYEQAFNDYQPEQAAAAHLGDRGMAIDPPLHPRILG